MLLRRVSAAVFAALCGLSAAHAQSANDFRGPRELPPASFAGQQFVDSQGCVYLRAGLSGRTNWVPRVSRDRKQLCGYPPTFAPQKIEVAEDVAPAPAPSVASAPVRAAKSAPAPTAQQPITKTAALAPRVVAAEPTKRTITPPPSAKISAETVKPRASGGKIGCYRDAPVAEVFRTQEGGTVVLCTKGDGDLSAARAPLFLEGRAGVAASGYIEAGRRQTGAAAAPKSSEAAVKPPKGYRAAWTDDRLNPNRAKGTAAGQMAQDQIWTREVPARLVADVAPKAARSAPVAKVQVSTKAKNEPASRLFVQVGTFGQAENAAGASSRLARLGLPVAQAKTTKGGKTLQIVMAGPFASSQEAQAALQMSRRSGFADAFIR